MRPLSATYNILIVIELNYLLMGPSFSLKQLAKLIYVLPLIQQSSVDGNQVQCADDASASAIVLIGPDRVVGPRQVSLMVTAPVLITRCQLYFNISWH